MFAISVVLAQFGQLLVVGRDQSDQLTTLFRMFEGRKDRDLGDVTEADHTETNLFVAHANRGCKVRTSYGVEPPANRCPPADSTATSFEPLA